MTRSNRRLIIAAVALGIVGGAFAWLINQKGDIVLDSKTESYIAAIENVDSGSRAVVIDKEGNIKPVEGWKEGMTDSEVAWDPAGNRLFLISDRTPDSGFQIFRWDAQRGGTPDQKSVDKASRNDLSFDAQAGVQSDLSGLVTIRGQVQEFIPRTAISSQVLPPKVARGGGDAEEGTSGSQSPLAVLYSQIGTSFRIARWMKNRQFVIAVMRREDNKEALIYQDLGVGVDGQTPQPQPILVANRFEVAVCKADGSAAISAIGIERPASIPKDQQAPRNGIFKIDPEAEPKISPVLLSMDDTAGFGKLDISPNGERIAFCVGPVENKFNIDVREISSCAFSDQGRETVLRIAAGTLSEPQFSPDGMTIAFLKREGKVQSIFLVDIDGTNARSLTKGKGDFSMPRFSPQYK